MNELRALALYVAALGPAAAALLAWPGPAAVAGKELAALCLALAAATGVGERWGAGALAARELRRLRVSALSLAGGLVLLSLGFAATTPRPALLARQTLLLVALQALFLLLPGLGPGRVPALSLSLALVVLASFRGGLAAGLASVSFAASLPAFLVFDHFSRRLVLQPQAARALLPSAVLEAARLTTPGLAALTLFLAWLPPAPHAGLDAATLDSLAGPDQLAAAYLQLGVFSLIGAAAVFYASRLLRRRKNARPSAPEEVLLERGGDEPLAERPARSRPSYAGTRGAVVQAYVRFLAFASGELLARRPDQTAAEIAALIPAPGEALLRLTAHFSAARYGPLEPSHADVDEARTRSAELIEWLRSRRGAADRSGSRRDAFR